MRRRCRTGGWPLNAELLVSETPKKMGLTNFVSEIKRVENYPDFEKLAHVIQQQQQLL